MSEIDVKRFYVPGGIHAECPQCKRDCQHEYLSYPTVGERFDLWFYCGECDLEFRKRALLTVELDIR